MERRCKSESASASDREGNRTNDLGVGTSRLLQRLCEFLRSSLVLSILVYQLMLTMMDSSASPGETGV